MSGPTVEETPRDAGMTLIEVLVAMGLFVMLGTLLLGLSLSTSAVTEDTRQRTGVNEESRIAMERMARELRQATIIDSVTLPVTEGVPGLTAFTFWTDFNGDNSRVATAADPEVLTYRWNPDTKRLTLTATDTTLETRPVLAANVTAFLVELRSSRWEYDADGDGITTWKELDSYGPPVGNNNGTADAAELQHIDLVAITMTVQDGTGSQTYRTQIDLRNRN